MDIVTPEQAAAELDAYLAAQAAKPLRRVITCGSVDDGKSTLIGRLLHDAHAIFDDQLSTLEADSKRHGTQGQGLDLALLVDGLAAEREQGITIDVAYRFFATDRARFILADCPGHEQYTRNMATGASTADAAIVLIDARKGVLTQTRRHSLIAKLLGIKQLVLAVNKMDLIDHDEAKFRQIAADYAAFAAEIGLPEVISIPISGLTGANVSNPSPDLAWYEGPTLVDWLENPAAKPEATGSLRLPVQWVSRPNLDFRGFAGTIASGIARAGDPVRILPGGQQTRIARILAPDGERQQAEADEAVTVTLADEVECARGSVIVAAGDPPQVADQFEATLVWMAEEALVPGRSYLLKLATQTVPVTLQAPKYQINVNTNEHLAARTLELNGIGVIEITTAQPIVFEPYADNRTLGGFILVDRVSNATLAAGMINFALRRSQNIHRQPLEISREAHASLKNQMPAVLWLTGLSGAGKSTIANLVEKKLHRMNRHTFLLDGDNVRHGLNKDLGFTETDRIENIRRVGEVSRLMTDAGLIVITAFISPFRAERDMVRAMMAPGEFIEVHIDTPLAEAEKRDVKGLYKKARSGQLKNFTGIDSPYEPPLTPEIRIDTTMMSAEAAAELIVEILLG
ncbi:sulfate adenylyltransferase subunit CysN [Polymorphobacter sp.]|uniref:sulfate adenylyltransferase subunit CysN n=1 Tax=Polymorphobacter sp. TaxID=1909290 RepID=UPI003F72ECDB